MDMLPPQRSSFLPNRAGDEAYRAAVREWDWRRAEDAIQDIENACREYAVRFRSARGDDALARLGAELISARIMPRIIKFRMGE